MSQPARSFMATGNTVNIDVTNSSNQVQISEAKGGIEVRVHNDGTATAWIVFGVTGVSASTSTSIPIPAGAIEVHRVPALGSALFVAARAAASTGKIYFTPGAGI